MLIPIGVLFGTLNPCQPHVINHLLLPAVCGWLVTSREDSIVFNLVGVATAMWLCVVGGDRFTLYHVTFALHATS